MGMAIFLGTRILYPNMNCHPDRSVTNWRACPERSRMGTRSFISNQSQRKHYPTLCHPERSRGICSSAGSSWKCFRGNGLGLEVRRVCPELVEGADRQNASPARQRWGFPNMVRAPEARHTCSSICIGTLSKNISRTSLQTADPSAWLGITKGRGGAFIEHPWPVERTAGPHSTSLRAGAAGLNW